MPGIWCDESLRETIEQLAAPAKAQISYVRQLGTFPLLDELALEFDYEYDRVRPGLGTETVSPGAAAALAALDAHLGTMSGAVNAELWRPPALLGHEWLETRRLARAALAALAETG